MTNKKIAKANVAISDGFDKDYYDWISELSQRYQQSQIKAAIKVNSEMLRFYWSVGKDIEQRQFENKYGSHFYENLSRDLSLAFNKKKGFSPTSLKYTKYFYCLYSPLFEIRRQVADELMTANRQQLVDNFFATTMPKAEGPDMPFPVLMHLLAYPNTNCLSSHSLKNCRKNYLLRAKLRMG